MKTFRKLAPLVISYLLLFALSAIGPFLSNFGAAARAHWVFLVILPLAIGCIPYSFLCGEMFQRSTRSTSRATWMLAIVHAIVIYVIFFAGLYDLVNQFGPLLYVIFLVPTFVCGLLFGFGAFIMRHEQAKSDARYGVEVRRGDPWASFFNLEWEGDAPSASSARRKAASRSRSSRPASLRRAEEHRDAIKTPRRS